MEVEKGQVAEHWEEASLHCYITVIEVGAALTHGCLDVVGHRFCLTAPFQVWPWPLLHATLLARWLGSLMPPAQGQGMESLSS